MHYAVRSREADINVNASPGDYDGVRVDMDDNTGTGTAFISGEFTPAQACELAAALLQAADEAEGVRPGVALERTSAILEHQYDPDEYADDPSLLPQVHAEALKIVRDVRHEAAAFIRANIDMQGRDFPDAESVAVWLEEGR